MNNQLVSPLTIQSQQPVTLDLARFALVVDTTHHYRPRWSGYDAHCRLRIWRSAQGDLHIVMFTELATNKGISITNYSENLATEIRRLHGLDTDTTIWIEHWPDSGLNRIDPRRQQSPLQRKEFDQLTYTWHNGTADDPQWRRLDPTHLQTLIGS